MSVRKSSHGTIFLIVSSGSPRALIASSLRSNIEKALLPHDPLAPSAHDRVRSPSQIRGDLARGIFRGALMVLFVLSNQEGQVQWATFEGEDTKSIWPSRTGIAKDEL